MNHRILPLLLAVTTGCTVSAQNIQLGPYTIEEISESVYHIEDANDSNPAGFQFDENGESVGTNNCSDIYLVVGSERAVLIDLSNAIRWDSTATLSLRKIVSERVGRKQLYVTVTHSHGDHLGMLPAFVDDPEVRFWIPGAEFKGTDRFPVDRTTFFAENELLDLGGNVVINTLEVPGHTAHSTIFFLKGKDLVFTGDAIGSGSGVWLFNEESFYTYIRSIDNLISYLEDSANQIDLIKLEIYGGHRWQKGDMEKLTSGYVYDMRTLIRRMGEGSAESEAMSSFISFLDTNFRYGTATITWNREAADRYAGSVN